MRILLKILNAQDYLTFNYNGNVHFYGQFCLLTFSWGFTNYYIYIIAVHTTQAFGGVKE